jgi:glycerol-3-phosphate dehydrogenase
VRKTGTEDLKVRGGLAYPRTQIEKDEWVENLAEETGFSNQYSAALFERYGTNATEVAREVNEISTEPLTSITDWTRGEVISLVHNEDVVHLDDLFQRRSSIAWVGALNLAVLDEMAAIVAHELGWSEDRKSAEIQRTIDEMREKHGIVLV